MQLNKFRLLLLLPLVVIYFFSGQIVMAQNAQSDINSIINQTPFYDPNSTNSGCDSNSTVGCGNCVAYGGTLDGYLQAEALWESGGNITAGSPQHASGKYQFEPATWKAWTNGSDHYYPPGGQYPYASAAPEEVQDATMYLGSLALYKSFNGNVFDMAVEHYLPAALTNQNLMNSVPSGNTLTPKQYGDMIALAVSSGNLAPPAGYQGNSGPISKIKLFYSNAPDFQTLLAADGGAPAAQTTASPTTGCGGSGVGNFVYYNQCDARWGTIPYGQGTICSSGCGPTSVAMVVATFADSSVTPIQTAAYSMQTGGYQNGAGTTWAFLANGPEHWGLKGANLGTDINKVISTLNGGGLVIAAGTGSAPFSTEGHILVLKGVSSDGNIIVADPDSQHTQSEYSMTTIMTAGARDFVGITK